MNVKIMKIICKEAYLNALTSQDRVENKFVGSGRPFNRLE
jgi:hypothetical protein